MFLILLLQPLTQAPSSVPPTTEVRHLPIICLTSKASPEDLRKYMAAGMDGCVSKPAEPAPLLNTLRAAVPLHLSPASSVDGRPLAVNPGINGGGGGGAGAGGGVGVKALHGKGLGILKGSAACAAEGMVIAGRQADDSVEGTLQVYIQHIYTLFVLILLQTVFYLHVGWVVRWVMFIVCIVCIVCVVCIVCALLGVCMLTVYLCVCQLHL